jgi:hypothetical protein
MLKKLELYEILVPTIMHDKPVRLRYHKVWDAMVRAIASGLTILTPVKGQWVSPSGTTFHERMIPVRIACTQEDMVKVANLTLKYYQQEAVMFYQVSDNVFVLYSKL